MVDLIPIIATAKRLITENGRAIILIAHDETLGDSAKPWEGPDDPRATPSATAALDALFVDPISAARLGLGLEASDLIMQSEQIMIVVPDGVDVTGFQEVLDAGVYWKITTIQVLKPGALVVLAYIGVKR